MPANYKTIENLPPPSGIRGEYVKAMREPMVDDAIYGYDELVQLLKEMKPQTKLATYFPELDRQLDGGLLPGELLVLSAKTAHGKTAFAQTISFLQAKAGIATLWFTLEMGWQEFTKKFQKMARQGESLPIFYPIDNRRLTLNWLDQKIAEGIEKYDIKMVFIDHLHFLLPLKDYRQNISFLIGGIVRELKQIAIRRRIPILLIAHTGKMDADREPDINSIRDSSFITQESDFVLVMWRERAKRTRQYGDQEELTYLNTAWVSLEKNRRTGVCKKFKIGFADGRFYGIQDYNNFQRIEKDASLYDVEELFNDE